MGDLLSDLADWQTEVLADEIVNLALTWADGDAELLRRAERVLARTRYLVPGRKRVNENEENEYLVLWGIDSTAPSPRAAAWDARAAQVREGTTATVFDVQDKVTGVVTQVDLDADPETDHVIDPLPGENP
jgi:hypothetical protein